jgi:hypothetical protein
VKHLASWFSKKQKQSHRASLDATRGGEETLKVQAGKQCWHHFSVAPQAVMAQCTHAGRMQYVGTKKKAEKAERRSGLRKCKSSEEQEVEKSNGA